MDVFGLRETIIGDNARFTRSFTKVRAPDIRAFLDAEYKRRQFWPAPLIQLNPSFVDGATVQDLVREGRSTRGVRADLPQRQGRGWVGRVPTAVAGGDYSECQI